MELENIDPAWRAEQAGRLMASKDLINRNKGKLILESLPKEYQIKAKWRRDMLLDEKI